jgi:2'-5' RNA ligase
VRLFAAVDLDRATRDAIAAEQRRIQASLGSSNAAPRWVAAERAHLTLVFLGHLDQARVPAVVEAMTHDVALAPFAVTFGGLGTFPLRGAPRVLWLGVNGGIDALGLLQQQIEARIAACGVAIEARAFHPHLTLGRWTSSGPADRAQALRAARPGTVAGERVARVTLYESRLSASGAAYVALAHANLIGA